VITIKFKSFTPKDIVLQDDAVHRKKNFGYVETFYYDALFDNKYSIVMLVNIIHLGISDIVFAGLIIYNNTKIVKRIQLKPPYKCYFLSEKEPLIVINNKQIVKGYINKDTKQWKYILSMGNEYQGADLKLIKIMKAWKRKTFLGNWLVIPKFKVKGKIFLNGNEIKVSGEGYHDHNIYPIYSPFVNKGYHFGKISIDSIKIIWVHVVKNKTNEEYIVILNKEKGYIQIDPKEFEFKIEKKTTDHGKIIPIICSLKIKNDILNLDVKIESIKFHHNSLPTINYWRHHVRNIGKFQMNTISKKIDNYEIAEYMRFF